VEIVYECIISCFHKFSRTYTLSLVLLQVDKLK